jgi:hypothetical protein
MPEDEIAEVSSPEAYAAQTRAVSETPCRQSVRSAAPGPARMEVRAQQQQLVWVRG